MQTVTVTGSANLQRQVKNLHHLDLAENAGTPAAAKVLLRDTDQNGAILAQFNLAASGDVHRTWSPPLRFAGGLYVQVSTGTVRGSATGN